MHPLLRLCACTAYLLLAPSALASNLQVRAFTADGEAVIYLDAQGGAGPDAEKSTVVVLDLRYGAEERFEAQSSDPSLRLSDLSQGFARWIKGRATVPARASRTSPDGRSTTDVSSAQAQSSGTWSDGEWSSKSSAGWNLNVVRGGVTRRAAVSPTASSVEVFWAPDGRHTVWVLQHAGTNMRDPGYGEIVVGTAGEPSIAVAASRRSKVKGAQAARALLDAGLSVVKLSEARRERPATVVFAAKGQEATAKKAAAALGGAAVEAMSWSSPFDVVVAVGGP